MITNEMSPLAFPRKRAHSEWLFPLVRRQLYGLHYQEAAGPDHWWDRMIGKWTSLIPSPVRINDCAVPRSTCFSTGEAWKGPKCESQNSKTGPQRAKTRLQCPKVVWKYANGARNVLKPCGGMPARFDGELM